MSSRIFILLIILVVFQPQAHASVVKEMIELPACSLQIRIIQGSEPATGPRFIMMDGVPLSGAVFQNLGQKLATHLDATSVLVDFPGVGGSSLKGKHYGWSPLRECLRQYLLTQPPSIIVLGDLGMPVVAPLLHELPKIQGLVIFNSVIKPSEVRPPFPLNFLRCCPRSAVVLGSVAPAAFFKKRIRDVGLGRPDKVGKEEVDSLYTEMRANHGLRRLARLMSDIELNEETDGLILDGLATTIPQLFLWGAADPALGAEYKKLPPFSANQRLIVIQDARHFLMMDYADELTEAIAAWQASLH